MKSFYNWLLVSSANPENTSMTIKGILLQYVSVIIASMAVLGVPLMDTQLIHYIDVGCAILGGLLGIFGLGRKIYYQFKSI